MSTADLLQGVWLFSGLDQGQLDAISRFTFRKAFGPGELIVEEGRTGNGLYTGMRRSELLGLCWNAVDLESRTISVTTTLQRIVGKGMVATQPKTARSRRSVSLPPSAVALLRGLRTKQAEERETIGVPWHNSDYVFSRSDGSPVDPDAVTHAFSRIIKQAGLPSIRFHDLRHTHASLMLKQGVHPKVVSERLGHASVTITLDTYSHVLPGLQEAAALSFEEGLQAVVGNREQSPTV